MQNEINLQTFLDHVPAIAYTKDLEGRYLTINKEFEKVLKFTPAQVCGKTDLDFLSPKIATALRANDQKAIAQRTAIHLEETVEVEDELHTYIATKFPLVDERGEVYAIAGISFDISDRKKSEDQLNQLNQELEQRVERRTIALKDSEARYRALMNGASDAILLFDISGYVIECNRMAEKLWGYSRNELDKLHISQIYPPDVFEEAIIPYLENLTNAQEVMPLSTFALRQNGSQVPIEITASLIEVNGEVITQGIFRDISDRHQAEQENQALRERLEFVLSSSPTIVYAFKGHGVNSITTFISDNIQSVLGYTSQEFLADPEFWQKNVHPHDLPKIDPEVGSLLTNSQHSTEYRFRHKDGSYRWLQDQARMVLDAQGFSIEFVGSLTDISDRKKSEEFLHLQNRFLGCLALSEPLPYCLDLLLSILELDIDCDHSAIFGINNSEQLISLTNSTTEIATAFENMAFDTAQATFGDRPVNVIDIHTNSHWQPYLHSLQGISTCWAVPIKVEHSHKILGYIHLYFSKSRLPSEHEIEIFKFTKYITGIAIERHQAEESLRESQKFIRQIADTSPNILYLYDLEERRNIYANNGIFNILGYSPEQVHQMQTNLFANLIYPNDVPQVNEHFEKLSQTTDGKALQVEYRAIHANGEIRWLLSSNASFSRNQNGEITQIIGIAQDISDRKLAEQELYKSREHLRQSEELLRLTIENTPIGICTFSLEANFLSANKDMCRIFGYALDELRQKNMVELTHPDYRQLTQAGVYQLIEGTERNVCLEKQYIHKSGRIVDAISRVSLIKDANGNPLHFVASVEDITEQKQLQLALKQRMENQSFLMSITQQIRQSLNLDQVLETAVNEVKRLLDCDRVIIFNLFNNGMSEVVKEALNPKYTSILAKSWIDMEYSDRWYEFYMDYDTPVINSEAAQRTWDNYVTKYMPEAQVKSLIVAPIIQHREDKIPSHPNFDQIERQQWTLLAVHACGEFRQWLPEEVELLQQITNQLAIAIKQANLYQQLKNQLNARKQFEQELTIQSTSDRLLSDIAVSINQSSQLERALDFSLEKVRQFLGADRLVIYQFIQDQHHQKTHKGIVLKEVVSRPELSIMGRIIEDSCAVLNTDELYGNGRAITIADTLSTDLEPCYANLLQQLQIRANLVTPIFHSNQLWGLLLVHQCDRPRAWQASEIKFIQQVATQIGTAGQKEKLYLQLSSELHQKKVLLKEIHHRVKNNLQVMSSILYLQFRNTPPEIKLLSEEYQNRIFSMSLIHEQLYCSDDLAQVDFYSYVNNLTTNLFQCYGINPELVQLIIEVEGIILPLDQSIPLGLIINELVSNALKYAFPKKHGTIKIKIWDDDGQIILIVADNGVGVPVDFDLETSNGLGMQLILSLTEQLEGKFSYSSQNNLTGLSGLNVQISFPNL